MKERIKDILKRLWTLVVIFVLLTQLASFVSKKIPDKTVLEWQQALSELSQPDTEWAYILRFSTNRLRFISPEPVAWTLDGEFGGNHQEITVETIHPGVRVLVDGI